MNFFVSEKYNECMTAMDKKVLSIDVLPSNMIIKRSYPLFNIYLFCCTRSRMFIHMKIKDVLLNKGRKYVYYIKKANFIVLI